MEKYNERGYKLLATAIVEQAAKDAFGWAPGIKGDTSRKHQIEEVKQFFYSQLFMLYMPNTDGKRLYKKIIDNFNKYGHYNSVFY